MAASLTPGIKALALSLQEAQMHSDVRQKLDAAVQDSFKGTGNYGYYVDHTGDGESGDVIYRAGGTFQKAQYEIGDRGGKSYTAVDTDNAVNVTPSVSYPEQADGDDEYAAMEAAGLYTKGPVPLVERFISKDSRDKADESDFAGKGKSFPILKREDVQAAIHAMGRAGSGNYGIAQLKKNIIAIAKRKGWEDELPKTWRGEDAKESKTPAAGALKLVESLNWKEDALRLIESSANPMRMKIKLIAPGKGSSAFYPAEVLKRDGPGVFTKGTHVYINHATPAEESARPEGDWHKLAGALDGNAYWDESAKAGPGLYGDALFTSDYAPLIKEKAAFTGMSIRASGVAESGSKKDGLPVLKQLTHAESVDIVTRAGAGGMILTESAKAANPNQEVDMTAEEIKALVESAVTAAVAKVQEKVNPLEARALRGDALIEANRVLSTMSLHESAKQRVVESVTRDGAFPVKDGAIDTAKFKELVEAEAKREGAYLAQITGGGRVYGMGNGAPVETDPAKLREANLAKVEKEKEFREAEGDVFGRLMGNPEAAKLAVAKGKAA